ncbi:hypothetical protein N7495_008868, partial [Penicillium taxi]|uniref:uncharacterized protein n=1 Tax=Penicillium taxi TaxID=168475 RepID=UPI002545ABC9
HPFHYGPAIRIRTESSKKEYAISRRLLCAESPIFSAMFMGAVKFKIKDAGDHSSAAIELVRLADIYGPVGLETPIAEYIKDAINEEYRDHPVRRILASASVEGYLNCERHKFSGGTQEYPSFGAGLLREGRLTLNKTPPS